MPAEHSLLCHAWESGAVLLGGVMKSCPWKGGWAASLPDPGRERKAAGPR